MLKLERFENGNCDTPDKSFIITDIETNDTFHIFYCDNGDIYWQSKSRNKQTTFDIQRNDLILYRIFRELFENIRTNSLFKKSEDDLFFDEKLYIDSIERLKPILYDKLLNKINFKSCDVVDWSKDDSKSHYFEIVENEKSYTLTFFNEGDRGCYIRINTNRSEYKNLVLLFVEFYRSLDKYYEYYQITMNDYIETVKPKIYKN